MRGPLLLLIIFCFIYGQGICQLNLPNQKPVDSIITVTSFKLEAPLFYSEKPPKLIGYTVPAALITFGFIAQSIDSLNGMDDEIKEEIWLESPHAKISADNFLQHAPAIAVYVLNFAGIKGRHKIVDRSMIYLMSNFFVNATVEPVKRVTHRLRPDETDYLSFPSGHTAHAFANAEFLRMEYKDVSPWYGIAGYGIAITTGLLRVYNNRHWLSDVVAGAGFGIISTKMAYWIYPKIRRILFEKKNYSINPHVALSY